MFSLEFETKLSLMHFDKEMDVSGVENSRH
jgi:hypothetical protein